jgi:hypothetical protein
MCISSHGRRVGVIFFIQKMMTFLAIKKEKEKERKKKKRMPDDMT